MASQKNDVKSLKKELALVKHELSDLQQSRPHRLAVALNEFRQNPLANLSKFKQLAAGLKSAPPLPPIEDELDAIERGLVYPTPLSSRMNTLRYPGLKVAVIGDIQPFINTAHVFLVGDSNWRELVRFKIDILIIQLSAYDEDVHADAVTAARSTGAKVVLLRDDTTGAAFDADLELDQTDSAKNGDTADKPHFDPLQHNPINSRPAIGSALTFSTQTQLEDVSPNDMLLIPSDANLSFKQRCTLLEQAAAGAIVVSDKFEWSLPEAKAKDFNDFSSELNQDLAKKQRLSIQQRRAVVLSCSNLSRFEFMIDQLGFRVKKPLVSIVLSTMRPDYLEQIANYIDSLNTTYVDKELVAVLHGDDFDEAEARQLFSQYNFATTVIKRSTDSIFGDNLNLGVAAASGDYITKMDDDDLYGDQHLNDLLAAYYFSNADIVGKWSHWVLFEQDAEAMVWVPEYQEVYARHIPGGTLFTSRRFLGRVGGFGSVTRGIDSELYRRADARGASLYSTHPYNYVRVRHGDHTYDASNSDFKSRCVKPAVPKSEIESTFI